MANNPNLSNLAANDAVDAIAAHLDSGLLRIYNGTQPATADDALSGQTLLAELGFGAPAFGAGSGGVATANAITPDSSANATGTATWYRCVKADGTTVICDGEIGTSGSDLNMNSVSIQAGAEVSVTGFALTIVK